MPDDPNLRAEVEQLISGSGAENDPNARHQLANLLANSSKALDIYLDHCEMEAMLRESYGLLNLEEAAVEKRGEMCPLHSPPVGWQSGTLRFVAIAGVLAAVVLLGLCLQPYSQFDSQARVLRHPGGDPSQGEAMLMPRSTQPLALITRSIGVLLHQDKYLGVPLKLGDQLGAGVFRLRHGVLELKFENGAAVTLQAPVDFELKTADHILVSQGRATIRCETPESQGFSVETPSSVAIDLGTEFAVDVAANGKKDDEFHVFSGEVLLKFKANSRPRQLSLREGQASRLDHRTGTPAGIDVDYQRFIRGSHDGRETYQKAILQLKPVSYFTMAPNGDGETIPNAVQDQPWAVVNNANPEHLWWATGFDGGTSLSMDGLHSATYAIAKDFPKATGDETSVVAWVYAESRIRWGSIAKNWQHGIDAAQRGQFHFGLHKDTGALAAQINDNDNVEQTVREGIPLPLFQWHHVAMVVDKTRLRLFRNGEEVASGRCNGLNGNPDIKQLAIGTKLGDQSLEPAVRNNGFWDGCIDHVAVFNQALSGEQVRQLYQVGISSMKSFRSGPDAVTP